MSVQISAVQIRSFVKGGNHGQYLQASGLRALTRSILPSAQVSHLDENNHVTREVMTHARNLTLTKYLAMRAVWQREFEFSKVDSPRTLTLYGSDQVWHCGSKLFHPNPRMFGADDSARKIAYAPSVATRSAQEPDWIGPHLRQFEWIGVRDANTARFVHEHTGEWPDVVIDPCFFYDHDQSPRHSQREGIAIYSPRVTQLKSKVRELALAANVTPLRQLGYYPRWTAVATVFDQARHPEFVLREVALSQLLITSTFHGVMMAIMTATPFIAVLGDSLAARLDGPISSSFSSRRLMSMEEFIELPQATALDFQDASDLNEQALADFRDRSRAQFAQAITD